MNKYARVPERIVDLHRHTRAEAERVLIELEAVGGHIRLVVGKGIHSRSGPVLRDFVTDWLDSRDIAYARAKIQDGGEGALEVYF